MQTQMIHRLIVAATLPSAAALVVPVFADAVGVFPHSREMIVKPAPTHWESEDQPLLGITLDLTTRGIEFANAVPGS